GGERPTRPAVDARETGGRRPDAESEQRRRGRGGAPAPAQLPPRVAQVEPGRLDQGDRVEVVDLFADARRVPQLAMGGATRLLRRHPAREVVVDLLREVGLQLARALVVPSAALEEASQAHARLL